MATRYLRLLSFVSVILFMASGANAADADTCEALSGIALPDVTVTAAEAKTTPVAHCLLNGRIGDHINFSVWLPTEWNGKFVMGGGGGFAGSVTNQAMQMAGALRKGYATAGTDTGHQANALDGSWALHDLEAIVNYGHVAVHRVTEVSKAIVATHYNKGAESSYFVGCSNGGRQALQEAQRYPDDFDVILAGAPALDFGGIGSSFTYITQRMYPDEDDLTTPLLSKEDRQLLRGAINQQCDAKDGVEDGILNDPNSCDFELSSLACSSGASTDCLSAEKIKVLQAIYDGPKTASGESLYRGYPFGAEDVDGNGWGSWLVGGKNMAGPGVPNAAYGFGTGMLRYFIYQDPDWTYEGYDFSSYEKDSQHIQQVLNSNDPDLDAFREQGGKLLMFHGWSDAALTANATIDYVGSVYERDPGAVEDVRLFMMPGVLHCFGGKGPSMVDWLGAMEAWEKTGDAPETLTAGFPGSGGRKLCAWPKTAHFVGDDDRDPDSFECRLAN